jgi:hypothetical protein
MQQKSAPQRVQTILQKAAITGGGLGSWASIADYIDAMAKFPLARPIKGIIAQRCALGGNAFPSLAGRQQAQQAFQESLRFDAILADGMVKAPLRSRGFSITTGIQGSVVPERSVKPVSSLVLAQQLLELKKAAAIVVVSKELGDFTGAARPDTLMQDRTSANSKNFSCNARPDHTLGQTEKSRERNGHGRFTFNNGHI